MLFRSIVDQAIANVGGGVARGGTNNPPSAPAPAPAPAVVRSSVAPKVDALVSPPTGQPEPLNTSTNGSSVGNLLLDRFVKGKDARVAFHDKAKNLMHEIGIQTPSEYRDSLMGQLGLEKKTTQEYGAALQKGLTDAMFGKDNWLQKYKDSRDQPFISQFVMNQKRKRQEQQANAMRQLLSDYYEGVGD
mgnify:CR=1 FL=1